jgi:hypothetical protein
MYSSWLLISIFLLILLCRFAFYWRQVIEVNLPHLFLDFDDFLCRLKILKLLGLVFWKPNVGGKGFDVRHFFELVNFNCPECFYFNLTM